MYIPLSISTPQTLFCVHVKMTRPQNLELLLTVSIAVYLNFEPPKFIMDIHRQTP